MSLTNRCGWQTLVMRRWTVGGGVIFDSDRILMVHNHRRGGRTDWSTPGGVIDEGETVLEGLTREVEEEPGLAVQGWSGPVSTVTTASSASETEAAAISNRGKKEPRLRPP